MPTHDFKNQITISDLCVEQLSAKRKICSEKTFLSRWLHTTSKIKMAICDLCKVSYKWTDWRVFTEIFGGFIDRLVMCGHHYVESILVNLCKEHHAHIGELICAK